MQMNFQCLVVILLVLVTEITCMLRPQRTAMPKQRYGRSLFQAVQAHAFTDPDSVGRLQQEEVGSPGELREDQAETQIGKQPLQASAAAGETASDPPSDALYAAMIPVSERAGGLQLNTRGAGVGVSSAAIHKFKVYNERWLAESEGIAEDFVSTPAMARLATGQFGRVELATLDLDGMAAVKRGVHATLSRCLHTLNLFKAINLFHDGVVPVREVLPGCAHRKLRLLFMLDKSVDHFQGRQVLSSSASVNIRLFPFAAALARRGHTAYVSDVEHLSQVNMSGLDAIIFVKTLGAAFHHLHNSSVPLIWDHVDEWNGFPFWDVDQWKLKEVFAGVLTAGRIAKVAFDRAGVPAQVVYHNHGNTANLHRPDRTPAVKVVALQGNHRTKHSDIYPKLAKYCKNHRLTLRSGDHTGHGWAVGEVAASLAQDSADHGGQLGSYMGYAAVDVVVLWPEMYSQSHICYKPTSRLAQVASLGIPIVTYPFASYIDILVEFGYPLVAETPDEVQNMLNKMIGSPKLRQEASEKLLEIADFLSVEELTEQYEQALCQFLSPEALELREGIQTNSM